MGARTPPRTTRPDPRGEVEGGGEEGCVWKWKGSKPLTPRGVAGTREEAVPTQMSVLAQTSEVTLCFCVRAGSMSVYVCGPSACGAYRSLLHNLAETHYRHLWSVEDVLLTGWLSPFLDLPSSSILTSTEELRTSTIEVRGSFGLGGFRRRHGQTWLGKQVRLDSGRGRRSRFELVVQRPLGYSLGSREKPLGGLPEAVWRPLGGCFEASWAVLGPS